MVVPFLNAFDDIILQEELIGHIHILNELLYLAFNQWVVPILVF